MTIPSTAVEPEVHPTVIWAKFKALREGADLATRKLWGKH